MSLKGHPAPRLAVQSVTGSRANQEGTRGADENKEESSQGQEGSRCHPIGYGVLESMKKPVMKLAVHQCLLEHSPPRAKLEGFGSSRKMPLPVQSKYFLSAQWLTRIWSLEAAAHLLRQYRERRSLWVSVVFTGGNQPSGLF